MKKQHKKSATRPAKINVAQNGEGSGNPSSNDITARTRAEALFAQIGVGRGHAVHISHRDNNDHVQRELRRLVAEARKNGAAIINLGDGNGYYYADLNNQDDRDALTRMIRTMIHRASEIEDAAYAMAEAVGGRYMDI